MSQSHSYAKQVIQVGDQMVELPEGVTVDQWALERQTWQNPRIRAFLGCLDLLDSVHDSNYAILHCSPERLRAVWERVGSVSRLMRESLPPLLDGGSCVPELDRVCRDADQSLGILERNVLARLDRWASGLPEDDLTPVRKLLCVSIGQVHAFLHETFAKMMAADPRSSRDADYFLSSRFPQDVEEAEWLYSTVEKLQKYLAGVSERHPTRIGRLVDTMNREDRLPTSQEWERVDAFLEEMVDGLTPRLRQVLALRGIRFDEMEEVDRYASDIPTRCRIAQELERAARAIQATAETTLDDGPESRAALGTTLRELISRLARHLSHVEDCYRDLIAFVPIWLGGISRRRALMLRKGGGADL